MTPAQQTAAPAATATPAPAAAPASAPATPAQGRDTYGDKIVSLSKIPVVGHIKDGEFKPVQKPGQEPPAEPAATPEGEEATEVTDGQPEGTEEKPAAETAVLKAKNGKTFKDAAELLATYDASAPEAQRLAGENKTLTLTIGGLESQLAETRDSLLKMQEYIANSAYSPNVPEKYKGMPETEMLAAMTEDERFEYRLDKREWSKKVEAFKTKMMNAKAESEALAGKIKAEIARVETTMSQDTASYPDFTELAPLRAEILKESPHLANRPDTPYIAYYVARGIMADRERAEKTRLEAESRANAGKQAAGAAAAAGAGAPAGAKGSSAPKNDGLRGLVNAAKGLKGHF
jgi:hypothetical protein